MDSPINWFYGMLAEATRRIKGDYFQLPVAEQDRVYRERVYAYELYHQLRCLWNGFPFQLGGEVDKAGHPFFQNGPYVRSKPDLLVHVPGDMENNLIVLEVKPCSARGDQVRKDLRKLTWFCHHANYCRGVFLVYGEPAQGVPALERRLRRALLHGQEVEAPLIDVFVHLSVHSPAQMLEV